MDIAALQASLRQFAAERDWQPLHTPKNLATALMGEAAELAKIFQWMTPEESRHAHDDASAQQHIGDEVADVLLYLLQIADHTGIDLKRAVGRKLRKNASKYPSLHPTTSIAEAARAARETHVLIDYENVQPQEDALLALIPGLTKVWAFHSPHQKGMDVRYSSLGERLALIRLAKPGKDALDFQLSFYVGYLASRYPDAELIVLSNDGGYESMLMHARELGFEARRVGLRPPTAKVTAPVTVPTQTAQAPAVAASPTVATPSAAPKDNAAAAKKPVAKKPAAKKSAAAKKAATKVPAKKVAVKVAKKAAQKTPAAKKTPTPAKKQAKFMFTLAEPLAPSKAKPVPIRPLVDGAAWTKKLTTSLRKMGANRPTKLTSLKRHLSSALGTLPEATEVHSLLANLTAAGVVSVSDANVVTYHLPAA